MNEISSQPLVLGKLIRKQRPKLKLDVNDVLCAELLFTANEEPTDFDNRVSDPTKGENFVD